MLKAVKKYNGTDSTGFALGNEGGDSDGTSDDSSSFTADDSEYNALNTDRELFAIRTIAQVAGAGGPEEEHVVLQRRIDAARD